MKVLIACEFSGRVRDAFIERGHDAISCDVIPSESDSGSHYQGDVRDLLKDDWDMVIAFPPCTYLALSGVHWLNKQEGRWNKMEEAADFFNLFLSLDCPRVCVENPVMHRYAREKLLRSNHTQIIRPYFFGHPEQKSTCLWLKGLPKLKATKDVQHEMFKLLPVDRQRIINHANSNQRKKKRSRTYLGVAKAMAEQWG